MVLTAIRKSEALRFRKEFINFDKGTLFIPKGISKTQYRDEELPLVPELGKAKTDENNNLELTNPTSLENFEIDKTSEN